MLIKDSYQCPVSVFMTLYFKGELFGTLHKDRGKCKQFTESLNSHQNVIQPCPQLEFRSAGFFPLPFPFLFFFLMFPVTCYKLFSHASGFSPAECLAWGLPPAAGVATGRPGFILQSSTLTFLTPSFAPDCALLWLLLPAFFYLYFSLLVLKARMHLCMERGIWAPSVQTTSLYNAVSQSTATAALYFPLVESKWTTKRQENH